MNDLRNYYELHSVVHSVDAERFLHWRKATTHKQFVVIYSSILVIGYVPPSKGTCIDQRTIPDLGILKNGFETMGERVCVIAKSNVTRIQSLPVYTTSIHSATTPSEV
jgi:hypothetical protein